MKLLKLLLIAAGFISAFQIAGIQRGVAQTSGKQSIATYRIDAAKSKFTVHAFRGGLLSYKGHDHFIKVGNFAGEVEITPSVINPASLNMTIRSDSLEETGTDFTAPQKQIIKKELDGIVLESAKYPEITFKSTDVAGKFVGAGFEAKIGGNMTLHGITRRIVIPATVTFDGNDLRAKGEFTINRKDFKVKATTAAHGLIRVQHRLKFTFDIAASRG